MRRNLFGNDAGRTASCLLNHELRVAGLMISHPYRCISVHIPKAAGNSVNRAFGIDWQNHKDLARYRAELSPEVFGSYFKFAIVRNPWARLLSDYNYQCRKSRPAESKLLLFDAHGVRRSFSAWASLALGAGSRLEATQWGGEVSAGIHRFSPQVDWISVDGQPGVDFVARLKSLDDDFAVIARATGLATMTLPRRNARFHFHYSHYYDDATRDLVARYYAEDVAAFGYGFEDRRLRPWWRGWRPLTAEETVKVAPANSSAR